MRSSISICIFCLAALLAESAPAQPGSQHATIAKLGELNGVALQCRYFEQTQRIKQVLVANLPKRRELGLLFEDATNSSFLAFMQRDDTCPGAAIFVRQVDSAITRLETAYGK